MKALATLSLAWMLALTATGAQQTAQQVVNTSTNFHALSDQQLAAAEVGMLGWLLNSNYPAASSLVSQSANWFAASDDDQNVAEAGLMALQTYGYLPPLSSLTGWAGLSDRALAEAKDCLIGQIAYGTNPYPSTISGAFAPYLFLSSQGLQGCAVSLLSQEYAGAALGPNLTLPAVKAWRGLNPRDLAAAKGYLLSMWQANLGASPTGLLVQTNTIYETYATYNRRLLDFHLPVWSGGNISLQADAYLADTNFGQFGGAVFLTNQTVYGNGHTLYVLTTNSAWGQAWIGPLPHLCVNGFGVLDGLIVTNIYDYYANTPSLSAGNYSNLVCRNCQFWGKSGVTVWLDKSTNVNYFTNCLIYASHVNQQGQFPENSFNVYLTGEYQINTFSNCVFSSDNSTTFQCVEPSSDHQTNVWAGCTFYNTNGTFSGTIHTNQAVAYVADQMDCRFTNCTFNSNQDSGAYFNRYDPDGQSSQCLYHLISLNNQGTCYYVGCTFTLNANGGTTTLLGSIVDANGPGTLTQFGTFQFINCTVSPSPGSSVIFYNNNFPVSIHGGNLTSANFSEPAKVTSF